MATVLCYNSLAPIVKVCSAQQSFERDRWVCVGNHELEIYTCSIKRTVPIECRRDYWNKRQYRYLCTKMRDKENVG